MANGKNALVNSFPPYFGVRRELQFPPLERIDFAALDGTALVLHHTSGGTRGPVLLSPGTAMTALSYCIDTVPQNIVEFLVARGFDVWLFDWRTSPLLAAHKQPYTLDDVGRFDWPAAVAEVRRRTNSKQVSVVAHCLSSPSFMLGLVRRHIAVGEIHSFVASQVALHLTMTTVGRWKLKTRLDRLLPGGEMMHQRPADTNGQLADLAISILSVLIPKSYHCDNPSCHRHSATFGDLILHSRVNRATHALMGDLIPECLTAFLKDVAVWRVDQTSLRLKTASTLTVCACPSTSYPAVKIGCLSLRAPGEASNCYAKKMAPTYIVAMYMTLLDISTLTSVRAQRKQSGPISPPLRRYNSLAHLR